jgi:hypothetical protein
VDVDPIVQHSGEEGVLAQAFGQVNGERPAIDDLAYLAWVGVAAPPSEQVAHNDQLRSIRRFVSVHAGVKSDQGIGSVCFPALGGGIAWLAGGLAGLAASSAGG